MEKGKKKGALEGIKDGILNQLTMAKYILKAKWDVGAEKGKMMKEQHKEQLKKLKKK